MSGWPPDPPYRLSPARCASRPPALAPAPGPPPGGGGAPPVGCAGAARGAAGRGGRVPLVEPGSVLPYVGDEAVLEGRVGEIRATDSGWAAVANDSAVSLPGGTGSLRLGTGPL